MRRQLKKQSHINTLGSHQPYIVNEFHVNILDLRFGDVIRFMYDRTLRLVYVVNPVWEDHLHGLDMSVIDRRFLMKEIVEKTDSTTDPYHFYGRFLTTDMMKHIDCYRTYAINKMQNLHKVSYELHALEYMGDKLESVETADIIIAKEISKS